MDTIAVVGNIAFDILLLVMIFNFLSKDDISQFGKYASLFIISALAFDVVINIADLLKTNDYAINFSYISFVIGNIVLTVVIVLAIVEYIMHKLRIRKAVNSH